MKIPNPRVSVLLATFNGETYLSEQLKSIGNQSDVEAFIVASDDRSLDLTPQLLNEACAVDRRITLLPSEKLGSAAANYIIIHKVMWMNKANETL